MDQLSAHLDRGWNLAQKGDARGALSCAERALELDPQSPEVHNLMGFASAMGGDVEDALEHYRQAIALDDTYFEAMLNASELMVGPLGDYDGALAQLSEALDYAETDEEIADCVLLRVDAWMAKGDLEEAKKAMAMIPEGPFEHPSYLFLIGRAYFELGQVDKAAPLIEEAVRRDPENGDAHYYLALVRDERGDNRGSTEAFLHTRALDLAHPSPSWAPSPDAFAKLVQSVLQKLDPVLSNYVREAEVYVVDVPGAELVVDGVDPRIPVLFDAPPPHLFADNASHRARLFVYQRNIERLTPSADHLEEELSRVLEREITAQFLEKEPADPANKKHLN